MTTLSEDFEDAALTVSPCLIASDPANMVDGQTATLLDQATPVPCGSGAATPTDLVIEPATGARVETGGTFPFIALALRSDGSWLVVTTSATWSVNDVAAASIGEHTGVAASLLEAPDQGGYATAAVIVTATYGGLTATAALTCYSACENTALDIMLVLDRSGSMGLAWGPLAITNMESVVRSCNILIDNMRAGRDMVGIVSFAGNIFQNPIVREKESTLDQVLTTDKTALKSSILSKYIIRTRGNANAPTGGFTGIGGGLQDAVAELATSRHRAGAQKVIILLSDGAENIDIPDPATVATAAKAAGITIVTIGISIPTTYQATLTSIATDGRAYLVEKPEDVQGIFAAIPHVLCAFFDPYGYGYGYLYDEPLTPSDPYAAPRSDTFIEGGIAYHWVNYGPGAVSVFYYPTMGLADGIYSSVAPDIEDWGAIAEWSANTLSIRLQNLRGYVNRSIAEGGDGVQTRLVSDMIPYWLSESGYVVGPANNAIAEYYNGTPTDNAYSPSARVSHLLDYTTWRLEPV